MKQQQQQEQEQEQFELQVHEQQLCSNHVQEGCTRHLKYGPCQQQHVHGQAWFDPSGRLRLLARRLLPPREKDIPGCRLGPPRLRLQGLLFGIDIVCVVRG